MIYTGIDTFNFIEIYNKNKKYKMEKYSMVVITRTYHNLEFEADSKEEALFKGNEVLANMKSHIPNDMEILENTVRKIKSK